MERDATTTYETKRKSALKNEVCRSPYTIRHSQIELPVFSTKCDVELGLGPILGSQPVWGIRPMGPTRGKEVKQLTFFLITHYITQDRRSSESTNTKQWLPTKLPQQLTARFSSERALLYATVGLNSHTPITV